MRSALKFSFLLHIYFLSLNEKIRAHGITPELAVRVLIMYVITSCDCAIL